MESCANTCQRLAPIEDPEVMDAAEALAGMLVDRAEFQNFLRLARAVRLAPEVTEILAQMNAFSGPNMDNHEPAGEALEACLEALPVMRGYRVAEQSARAVFAAVEQAISAAAGLPFAENAKASACG